MRLSIVMAVMYVMGRFGVWEPYLRFTQMVLDILDLFYGGLSDAQVGV